MDPVKKSDPLPRDFEKVTECAKLPQRTDPKPAKERYMSHDSDTGYIQELFNNFENTITGKLLSKTSPKLINELRELIKIFNSRPPRIMIIGRRGVGKSSLINAFFGKNVVDIGSVVAQTSSAKWVQITSNNKELRLLDTRGVGEGGQVENADAKSALESVKKAIKDECPDVILYVCKAKEVDANVEPDIQYFNSVLRYVKKNYQIKEMKVIAVVNQADELDPKNALFDDEEKMSNIGTAVRHTFDMLKKYSTQYSQQYDLFDEVLVVPVCSYMYFDRVTGEIKEDERWNIDYLFTHIVENLPLETLLTAMKILNVKDLQVKVAKRIKHIFASLCGAIGTQPIPIADLPVISSLQISMISMIAAIAGRKLELKTLSELLAAMGINIGGGFVFKEIARALFKLWPGGGNAISGVIAGTITEIYGEAAIQYFIHQKDINLIRKTIEEQMEDV